MSEITLRNLIILVGGCFVFAVSFTVADTFLIREMRESDPAQKTKYTIVWENKERSNCNAIMPGDTETQIDQKIICEYINIEDSKKKNVVIIFFIFITLYSIYLLISNMDSVPRRDKYNSTLHEISSLKSLGNLEARSQKDIIKYELVFEELDIIKNRIREYIDSLRTRNGWTLLLAFAAFGVAGWLLFLTWRDLPGEYYSQRIAEIPYTESVRFEESIVSESQEKLVEANQLFLTFRIFSMLFIQTFSFFFLINYRRTLAEIRYYQNELSNFEIQFGMLALSFVSGNPGASKKIIEHMSKSERNFPLKEGEYLHGTRNLSKIEQSSILEWLKKLGNGG